MISALVVSNPSDQFPMLTKARADLYGTPTRYSTTRKDASARYSTASSDASSLYRTASTNSNNSTSRWSMSSVSSAESHLKHRKAFSHGHLHLPRALQPFHKKAAPPPLPQQQQRSPPPPRPPRPEERAQRRTVPSPEPIIESPCTPDVGTPWQCADLVVRCKEEVYHVDRTIMCYHSRWFARICAIIKTSVCRRRSALLSDTNDLSDIEERYRS